MQRRLKLWLLGGAVAIVAAGLADFYLVLVRPRVPTGRRVVRSPRANVLLITLDTTRPDRIGAYGYPGAITPEIDRLAHSGVMFENAYSPVPLTLPAHASILTGTYPPYHGVRNNGKYLLVPQAVTLAELLKDSGYRTAAFVSSFILDSRFGLDQGFDYYGDRMDDPSPIKNLESERRASSVYEDFARWVEHFPGGPFFAWVHFFDPHFPYQPPEPFKSDPRLPDPYDGEIASMDVSVGKIVRLLEAKGYLGSTTVILVGDHGEAFGEHKENGHTIFCYEENIRIPLIFFGPSFWPQGLRISNRANLIDILPTLLDLIKLKIPGFVQGQSLIPVISGRRVPERDFYFESLYSREVLGCASLQGVLSGNLKLIRLPRTELYDLSEDRSEKNNLVDLRPAEADRMLAILAHLEKGFSGPDWLSGRVLRNEEKKRLESLGYLSNSSRPEISSSFDPKDRIDFWNKSQHAGRLLVEGKFAAAESLLLSLFEEDPHFNPVIENLGELYFRQKKIHSLIHLFEQAIEKNPQSCGLRILYGRHLIRSGLAEQAVPVLEAAENLAGPDEKEQVYFILANALGQLKKYEEAASRFKRVLELESENYEAERLLGYSLMQLGRYEEALKHFGQAEKGMPDNPRLLEDTAMSLANLGKFREALPYFEKATKLNPEAPTYANYALACAQIGDYGRAIGLMENALSLPEVDNKLKSFGQRMIHEWRLKK
ncbi:MAG: sulfatase-like hydrolase/transferase [Candidatus Aminicenantales bacterium]